MVRTPIAFPVIPSMKQVLLVPVLILGALGCSQPATDAQPIVEQESPVEPIDVVNRVPEFASLDEAIDFATQVENLLAYDGLIHGSERYEVELPSGATIDNWTVNCFFRGVFSGHGEEAHAALAPLLDHEHTFAQVGVHAILNSAMFKHGLRRRTKDTREERVATMKAFQSILASQETPSAQR